MFQVQNGEVLADSYQSCPAHRLFTEHGFFRLDPCLEARLYEAVRRSGEHST